MSRSSVSSILIENTGDWTDTEVEALLDTLSGTDAHRHGLLVETLGRLYQIANGGLRVWQNGENYQGQLILEEWDRVGAISPGVS